MWSRKYDKCIKCGTTESKHKGNGMCKRCWNKKWIKDNPEKVKKMSKKYYKENVDKVKEYGKRYYKENFEEIKKSNKKWQEANRGKCRSASRRCYWKNPEKVRERKLISKYNITLKDYNQLLEKQNYRCAICGSESPWNVGNNNKSKSFHVDHCHKTGKVRGLLCNNCNRGVGFFQDSENLLLKAIDYLHYHK